MSATITDAPSVSQPPAVADRPINGRKLIAIGVLAVLAAATMIGLGFWQLSRYRERSAINDRIDAAGHQKPISLPQILAPGEPMPRSREWRRVEVTGTYQPQNQILVRGRTVNDRVGFEVLTPLRLSDATTVFVNRGWVPPAVGGAMEPPTVPAAPSGIVTVTGRLRAPESGGTVATPFAGHRAVRRIDPGKLGASYRGYVTADPAEDGFVPIGVTYANASQNIGYVGQWWLFAVITLIGYAWFVRRTRIGAKP